MRVHCTERIFLREDPQSMEEIAHDYDIPIEAVHEAIAYCEADPPEIREDFAREAALVNAFAITGRITKLTLCRRTLGRDREQSLTGVKTLSVTANRRPT